MNFEIKIAQNAGFCFGVERAVKTVYSLCESEKDTVIATLGSLIHNPTITGDLSDRGVRVIDSDGIDGLFEEAENGRKVMVVIRAHGVQKEIYEKLESCSEKSANFRFADCTCPYVKKIHDIVKNNTGENDLLIVFGDPDHPEVKGIVSFAKGEYLVIRSCDELDVGQIAQKPVVLVSQTTQNLTEWKKTQKIIEKYCTNRHIFDTICTVTGKRQNETALLAEKVDCMLIIGGKNSSNTNKLFSVSKERNPNTFLIENADEIPFDKIGDAKIIGISAGASTPGDIIQEVKNTMSELNEKVAAEVTQDSVEKPDEGNFAELLENSLKTLNTGDIVKGTILSVNDNEIQVDLGAKFTGIIPYSEVSEDPSVKLSDSFKIGDEIEAMVTRVSDLDGVATLSKKRVDVISSWKSIIDARENDTVLEGKIVDVIKGGMLILINGQKVFIPASQSGLPKDAQLNELKGTTQKVKIIDINEQRKRAVASIRVVKREERKAKENEIWANIEKGKKYEGKVKSMTSYGVFVDLGGVDGMVHASELSWTHIKHPSEVVSVGDTITVFVKDFDPEKKRISLGYKTEENDPWNKFTAEYAKDDEVEVKIVSMMPFGAFAEIIPGVDGLIHISQIANRKITKPADVLELGQTVKVKITDIDTANRKVSLSIRALLSDEAPVEEEKEEAPVEEAKEEAPAEEAKEENEEKPAETTEG